MTAQEGFWEGEGEERRFWPACDYPRTQKLRVTANNIRFWVEVEGQGPPLLLVHGGPGIDHRIFHPELSRLAKLRRLIYYDMRGHHMSSEPEDPDDYGLSKDVEDLEALRQALGYEWIDLLGYSYGGAVALCYAARFGERLRSLIVCSTPVGLTVAEVERHSEAHPLSKAIVQAKTPEEAQEALRRFYFYKPPGAEARRYFDAVIEAYNRTQKNRRLLAGHSEEKLKLEWDALMESPPEVEVPMLFLFGRHDPIVDLNRAARWITSHYGRAKILVFEKSRHSPFVDEPEAFQAEVAAFLESEGK